MQIVTCSGLCLAPLLVTPSVSDPQHRTSHYPWDNTVGHCVIGIVLKLIVLLAQSDPGANAGSGTDYSLQSLRVGAGLRKLP